MDHLDSLKEKAKNINKEKYIVNVSTNKYKGKEKDSSFINHLDEYKEPKRFFRDDEKHKWIGKDFKSLVINHKGMYKL